MRLDCQPISGKKALDSCHFSALSYENVQEVVGYCDGPDVQLCSVDGQEYGVFQAYDLPGSSENGGGGSSNSSSTSPGDESSSGKRGLRSSPTSCAARNEFLESVMADCDRGGKKGGWSNWLRWKVLWQDGDMIYRSRRRYCQVT